MDVVVNACAALAPRTHEPDYRAFGEELDEVKRRALARVGPEDVAYVKRLNRFSRVMEVIGRVLIHVSPEPVTFTLGVGALWLHKQLQATEIGHTALHGAYDRSTAPSGSARARSAGTRPSTRSRGVTATTCSTTATRTSPARTRTSTSAPRASPSRRPSRRGSGSSCAFMVGVLAPNFAFLMNIHFTGLNDVFFDNGLEQKLDFLPDRSRASKRARVEALRSASACPTT